jgi:hypothetical protein
VMNSGIIEGDATFAQQRKCRAKAAFFIDRWKRDGSHAPRYLCEAAAAGGHPTTYPTRQADRHSEPSSNSGRVIDPRTGHTVHGSH